MPERLESLRPYLSTAVFTGKMLLFISESFKVELTEIHKSGFINESIPCIRVRIYMMGPHGGYEPCHYEDFELEDLSDMAGEIEKFVQAAVGKNLKEI